MTSRLLMIVRWLVGHSGPEDEAVKEQSVKIDRVTSHVDRIAETEARLVRESRERRR